MESDYKILCDQISACDVDFMTLSVYLKKINEHKTHEPLHPLHSLHKNLQQPKNGRNRNNQVMYGTALISVKY